MIARARLIGVVGFLIAGATGLISSTQTWLLVSLSDGAAEPLAVAGASAVVLLAPLSLTALALGAALSIVGRILRPVFGVIGAVLGIALAILTAPIAIQAPVSAVSAEVAAVTGIRGESAIAELVAGITATTWPAITLVAAVLMAAAGIWVLATARLWPEGGRRYQSERAERRRSGGPLDAIDSWDDLSRGGDPTT
ncbi:MULTISPECIES: Trp biosynthesis-associated membrane protein [Microbacterium]|uniref:Trp biosynthesis-associated membrane protein n=1 Tax=Microbacterium schleiferi TaxID=69362 RepID=A0ABU7V577_9MICO|nr:Trp biosynthesis-associated membrane protein [Microbacterium sp.]MBD3752841.1 Trp biosynthesis-associated membrane protein [Micrococcales bacterium]